MRQFDRNEQYEKTLSDWHGYKVRSMDDFDTICQCDYDFIELLMVFEKEYHINLLESEKERQDFDKAKDFIEWAKSRPSSKEPYNGFRFYEPQILSILGSLEMEEV